MFRKSLLNQELFYKLDFICLFSSSEYLHWNDSLKEYYDDFLIGGQKYKDSYYELKAYFRRKHDFVFKDYGYHKNYGWIQVHKDNIIIISSRRNSKNIFVSIQDDINEAVEYCDFLVRDFKKFIN